VPAPVITFPESLPVSARREDIARAFAAHPVIVVCGDGGCLERTVNDYGPVKKIRIVDMYRPDFFKICGCGWWEGTTWVTVSVY